VPQDATGHDPPRKQPRGDNVGGAGPAASQGQPAQQKRLGQQSDAGDELRRTYGLMGIGFEFAAAVAVPTVIGLLLDRWLKTLPWLTVVGLFLGFTIGMVQMVRLGKRGSRD
jgi:F0F1-type ATP synthase assembly protein I